jgi:hypothetical protein
MVTITKTSLNLITPGFGPVDKRCRDSRLVSFNYGGKQNVKEERIRGNFTVRLKKVRGVVLRLKMLAVQ